MKIKFGKYKDELLEVILLKHPEYIAWMLKQSDGSQLKRTKIEVERLMKT